MEKNIKKEKMKVYRKRWLAKNPDYHKEWRRRNPAYMKEWRKKNIGYYYPYYEKKFKRIFILPGQDKSEICEYCGSVAGQLVDEFSKVYFPNMKVPVCYEIKCPFEKGHGKSRYNIDKEEVVVKEEKNGEKKVWDGKKTLVYVRWVEKRDG